MPEVDPRQHDRFVMKQRFTMVVNRYEFYLAEDETTPFCFVEQKRFKFKEDIRFFSDASKTNELIRILARQRFDPRATYDVTSANGVKLGEIQKVFGKSLFRSTYRIADATGNGDVIAREKSVAMAAVRRFIDIPAMLLPGGDIVRSLMNWLPFPYDFEFLRGETVLGINKRRRGKLIDVYDIDFSADAERTLDRWMLIALCVGMDALQAR
ncbi:MAG: hypothetical protein JHC87_03940 [Thermoleophilaceae bacterium]|nr:hypothetical protein [Thermoleophilaceae bacterium]